ncbi:MAG: acylneuraminate cytidylyltransferase family protein [Nitrospirae bacterium]|nr:MAG: acylneuraminate cytidylyltransferase family protein [Nitrospirota bacterium]
MRITAFIPARGGSKGIPKKNLALLNGKPLIQYTIEAAKKSRYINDIFVSSDDSEIIGFCESVGVSVPYRRPEELATDSSSIVDTLMHALDWMGKRKELPYVIMLLQPTSPLRTANNIDEAVELFVSDGAESLISVHRMVEHPYECLKVAAGGWEYLVRPEKEAFRRQDYNEDFYYINGAIYIVKTDFFIREKKFVLENRTKLYIMPPEKGVDVDDALGLKKAECYFGL